MWTNDLDYFFYSVRPGAEGPCGQLQMTAVLMESFSWDPCVYTGLKVTFHTQKLALKLQICKIESARVHETVVPCKFT